MGSEMCIRDSVGIGTSAARLDQRSAVLRQVAHPDHLLVGMIYRCLLYTSDAADERSRVDLGGRRLINKKIRCDHSGRRSR